MGLSAKQVVGIGVGLAVVAAGIRVGMSIAARAAGCPAGRNPAPRGAPPFPQSPSDRHGVWTVNIDGSHETPVPAGLAGRWPPLAAMAWSPDGTQIASTDSASYALTLTSLDGSVSRTLIPEPKPSPLGSSAAEPAWSPDGTQLAFIAGSIQVINADGTGRRAVTTTNPNSTVQAHEPAWSPDGMRLAYDNDFNTIDVVNVDGTGQRTITRQTNFRLSHPAWSPDGRRLVFAAGGGYYGSWLGIIRPDGAALRHIASHCGAGSPTWSPDGTKIAFEDFYGLNIIDADGTHRTRVPNSWYGHQPAWSPDGHQLLFFRY